FLASVSILMTSFPFPFNWLAIVPIGLTLLSHRLSTQTLFAIFVGLSIVNFEYAFILVAGLVFAVAISKGEYVTIVRAHGAAVAKYYRKRGYPNERLSGSFLTPAIFGYLLYLGIFILQRTSIILTLGYTIPPLYTSNPEFEIMMIIWASACFVLMILWLAGESYKHLSMAAVPFAFLTALLAFTHEIFLIIAIILIIASFIESLYFQLRFEHIEEDLVNLLKHSSLIGGEGTMFAPKNVVRAVSFYTSYRVIQIYHDVWSKEHFDKRVEGENPSVAVVNKKHRDWYSDWNEVENQGDWILFRT
ncbi:MAG: hypothetical protein ACFFEV_07945, partial [Candidatus Thorarchaeota archaeon]